MKNENNILIHKTIKLLKINEILQPKNNWISEIEKVIVELGIRELVNHIIQNNEPSKNTKAEIKRAVWDWKYREYNQLQFHSKSVKKYLKMTNYKIGPHGYLNYTGDDNIIKSMIRFKVGGFNLNYRNNKIPEIVKHTCKQHNKAMPVTETCSCDNLSVEDELHVLTMCKKYEKPRQQYYPTIKYIKSYEGIGILMDKNTLENSQNLMMLIFHIENINKKSSEADCRCINPTELVNQ